MTTTSWPIWCRRSPVVLRGTDSHDHVLPQVAILLQLGLQYKEMDDVAKGLGLPTPQVMALYNKAMRKLLYTALRTAKEREVEAAMPPGSVPELKPHAVGLDDPGGRVSGFDRPRRYFLPISNPSFLRSAR